MEIRIMSIKWCMCMSIVLCFLVGGTTTMTCVPCPTGCVCSLNSSNNLCLVNCSSAELQRAPFLHELPVDTYQLDLTHNHIRILPHNFFSGLKSFTALFLSHNAWNCNCDLKWLQIWMTKNKHKVPDWNSTLCSYPASLTKTRVVDANLSKDDCADGYISCAWNTKKQELDFILWEYMENNISSETNCTRLCFSKGYFFGNFLAENTSCLCALENSSDVLLHNHSYWLMCNETCSITSLQEACGRKIVRDVVRASPQLQFTGLREYSQQEEVVILVRPKRPIASNFLWNFNDSTPTVLTSQLQVRHKYATTGRFWVTVAAQQGIGIETYSMLVTVQKTVHKLDLVCPKKVYVSTIPSVALNIVSGNSLYLHWDVNGSSNNFYAGKHQCLISSKSKFLCYQLIQNKYNWTNAQQSCQEAHGDLIVVDTAAVQNDVERMLTGTNGYIWIGLNSYFLKGTFLHINGLGLLDSNFNHPQFTHSIGPLQTPPKDCMSVNENGQWFPQECQEKFGFICQYHLAEKLADPKSYLSGTAIFQSNAVKIIDAANVKNVTVYEKENYTILFPGFWIPDDAKITSWELVARESSAPLRLQIYRPICRVGHLNFPGCKESPYATCHSTSCANSIAEECFPGLAQYCYFNNSLEHCRALDLPCNWYDEYKLKTPARHQFEIPYYSLVVDHVIAINQSGINLYQSLSKYDTELKKNDIVGIGFSSNSTNQLADMPLVCINSSLSSWRQSAMLFTSNKWTNIDANHQTYRWMDNIWCDVRLHLSQTSSQTKFAYNNFNMTEPGAYEYIATVTNSAMDKFSPLSSNCSIEYVTRQLFIEVVSPERIIKTSDKSSLYVEKGKQFLIKAKLVGKNALRSVWSLKTTDGNSKMKEDMFNCSDEYCINQSVSFTQLGRSVIQLEAEQEGRSGVMNIQVFAEEKINGARILPQGLNRVLVGIPQIFMSDWSNGTNVTITWIIDELNQYGLLHNSYTVLFRKPGQYKLSMMLSNHISTSNTSIFLRAEEMVKLTDLKFVDAPSILLFGSNVTLHLSVLVDENIEADVMWYLDGSLKKTESYSPPYNFSKEGGTSQILLKDELEMSFAFSATIQKLKVVVSNDYDSAMTETSVDIRGNLSGLLIFESSMKSNLPTGMSEFGVQFSPLHNTEFFIDWNDGSLPYETVIAQGFTLQHNYTTSGVFNVSICANNSVSYLCNWTIFLLHEKLKDVELIADNITEVNLTYVATVSIKGNNKNVTLFWDFGDNTTVFTSHTSSDYYNISHVYVRSGIFNVTATVQNPVSMESTSMEVNVYTVEIMEVFMDHTCYVTNSNFSVSVIMTIQRPFLFGYMWNLDDKTILSNNSVLVYSYAKAGIYFGNVRAYSLKSSDSHSMNFSLCIQEPISSVVLAPENTLILSGSLLDFHYEIIGGTNVTGLIVWDTNSSHEISNTTGNVSHYFLLFGVHNVLLNASNEISHQSSIVRIRVLDEVKDLVVTTNSPYGTAIAKGHNVTYTASYSGSNVSVLWKFGDMSGNKHGDMVSHIYSNEDNYFSTVKAWNDLSEDSTRLEIVVQSPVEGVTVSVVPEVISENTLVWFNITDKANANTFRWKVSSSQSCTSQTWGSKLEISYFSHFFTTPGKYIICLMAENEVSSENFTVSLLVVANISLLDIISNDTKNGYGPAAELVSFVGVTYNNVSVASPLPINNCSTAEWKIIDANNNTIVNMYTNSSRLEVVFDKTGVYEVWLNASNCLEKKQITRKTVTIIERISNITLKKINSPNNAVSIGEKVTIEAVVTKGTDLLYSWKAHVTFQDTVSNTSLFNFTYTHPYKYTVYLEISNPLNKMVKTFTLYVQEPIKGLHVEHLESVVPFYVAYGKNSLFHASVSNGSSVIYTWQFVDVKTKVQSESKCTVHGTINWNFTEITTYLLMLNASNYISWDHLNTTVHVISPLTNLRVVVERKTIAMQQNFSVLASASSVGSDVSFVFDMGDGSPSSLGSPVNLTTAQKHYSYSVSGNYTIFVEALNNATILNEKVSLSVREPIAGLQVLGIKSDSFIAVNVSYNLSALVEVGTDVTFSWYIQQPTHSSTSFGSKYDLTVASPDIVNVTVVANNVISESARFFLVTAQIPPDVDISLTNNDKRYVNELVTLNINVHAGTKLVHSIDFGDGNVLNTTESLAENKYDLPGEYVITVISFNSASRLIRKIGITILKLVCEPPNLAFVGNNINQSKFYRSRNIYIETEIETFGCNEYIVKYVWKMYQQLNCEDLNDATIVKLPLARTPLLVLGPLTLKIGRYCVVCTASFIGTPLEHTVSTQIQIISTPLAVIITGGTYRTVSQSSELVLDASSSFDPDLDITQQTDIYFNWTCEAMTTSSGTFGGIVSKGEDNCFAIMQGQTIRFDGMNFLPGLQYNFTVTAFKEGKVPVSSWQSINFVQNIIPTVTVTCVSCQHQSSLRTSSAHHLTLLGSCDTCEKTDEVFYSWEAFCKNSSTDRRWKFPLNALTTTTGSTGRYLVIRAGAMGSCNEYEFELAIKVNNHSGFSKLVLSANKPPVNGNCTLSFQGEHIYVLETLVRFQCFGWEDEDISLLVYTILAIRYTDSIVTDEFIIYRGTASEYEAYLPLGFRDNNFDLTLQIIVEDELGTFSVGLNRSIVVQLSPETKVDTIQWLRNKTFGQLAELGKSSNPQLVVDYAAGLITVLNQDSELQSQSTDDAAFESRREIRNNITRTVTSLTAQTLDEMKQVTTVFKQCVKIPSELQDSDLQNVSIQRLVELTGKMPEYVDVASQTTFMTVTENLLDIASYMVDSVNYVVYGDESIKMQDLKPLNEAYRKDMVEVLMNSAVQLTSNVLDGKVEGEEPFFLNATAMSSVGARSSVANMNRSVQNDGCFFEFPRQLFCSISDDTEILYVLVVAEQNPYTFGHTQTHLASSGHTNISTRVPVFEFKTTDHTTLQLCSSDDHENIMSTSDLIRIVMATSDDKFITPDDTSEIAAVEQSSNYYPRRGILFQNFTIKGQQSLGLLVNNNNTDHATAVYLMVVYDLLSESEEHESNPFIDVLFHTSFLPNSSNYIKHMRLWKETIHPQADHKNYTIYISSGNGNTVPNFFLNVTSYFKYSDALLQVAVYYCACQFYDTENSMWSTLGIMTSHETTPSAAVCYSNHLTSFGSFVLNPPNLVDITEIKNINFTQNPVALIVVVVVFAIYLLGAIWCRFLDVRDLEKANGVPLCGSNGQYKYEISIKTSPGIGSGTTANVGIIVYGYKAKSGSKHLFKLGAFQRGSVDMFQIACDIDIGVIYKIKLWHDNTGLDPAWNVSRIMIKDLHNGECYFFLADTWLQVYPHDDDDSCLIKTICVASEEEMSDFLLRFGNQLSYGWEDVHLWLSLIERPVRSNFSRVQRLTCCVTLLYSFMVLCAFWYQNYDDETFQLFRWQDIAVGLIVTIMVFPINMLIVFCFKNSKCKVDTIKQWTNRAQTAQTVEILNEILEGNTMQNFHPKSTHLSHLEPSCDFVDVEPCEMKFKYEKDVEDHSTHTLHKTTGTIRSLDIRSKSWVSEENHDYYGSLDGDSRGVSDDTGISSAEEISTPDIMLNTDSLSHDVVSIEDNFWDSVFVEDFSTKHDQKNSRTLTLKRTHKTIFEGNANLSSSKNHDTEEVEPKDVTSNKSGLEKNKTFMLPHQFVYFAYFTCYSVIVVSIFFVILYGHGFGVEKSIRWLTSMLISLGGSFFLIEPVKVIFFAAYISLFTKQPLPEYESQRTEDSFIENYEHVQKRNKIWPPGGYALEQCKEQAKKSERATQLIQRLLLNSLLLSSLLCFVFVQRVPGSFWDIHSIKTVLHKNYSVAQETYPFHTNKSMLSDIRTINDIWIWTNSVFVPTTLTNEGPVGSHYNLLGEVKICQQRYLPESCIVKIMAENIESTCISNWNKDTSHYSPGWRERNLSSSTPWSFSTGKSSIGLWGLHQVYDDSGYCAFLDVNNSTEKLHNLKQANWLDNMTSLYFVEFAHYSLTSLGSVVSLVLFEIDETGVVLPSYTGISVRLFSPEYVTLDMVFMALFGITVIMYWSYEVHQLFQSKQHCSNHFKNIQQYKKLLILICSSVCCSLFVYKLILLKYSMASYKTNKKEFTSFYEVACVSEILTVMSAFLLTALCLQTIQLLKYIKKYSTVVKTLNNCFNLIMGSSLIFSALILFYAQVFGLNGGQTIEAFGSFWKSLASMFYIVCRGLKTKICFDAYPLFSIAFFYSFYFCVCLLVGRLCTVILKHGYKDDKHVHNRNEQNDSEVFDYLINRIKLRFGITKPKQYRHRVHFEGMSTPSLRGSMNSLDSFGTCFTPGRISQCSDTSDLSVSSSDSGLGTPSDHSLSLFDYLTLENPPLEKPIDIIHLNSIYNRVSTYSVDMLLHRFDRVNKLANDLLTIERKLLEISEKSKQQKVLQGQAIHIAKAAATVTYQNPQESIIPKEEKLLDTTVDKLLSNKTTPNKSSFPLRSSSYTDHVVSSHSTPKHQTLATKKRPYSDEGMRPQHPPTDVGHLKTASKKSAW